MLVLVLLVWVGRSVLFLLCSVVIGDVFMFVDFSFSIIESFFIFLSIIDILGW